MRPKAIHVADLFYDRLFELDPSLEALFPEDLSVQRPSFSRAMAAAVNGLDDVEGLRTVLRDLGLENQRRGIEPGHYVTLGRALLWTFEQTLAEDFTPLVKDAWAVLCASLSGAMLRGAELREADAPRELSQLAM
jgi:hemoglobin-like flavoprotein